MFIQEIDPGNSNALVIVITAAITALITIIPAYFSHVLKTKTQSKKEIELAKLEKMADDSQDEAGLLIALRKELQDIRLLLEEERKLRATIEQKFESVKIAFDIIYNQYEREFKNDPLIL